MKKLLTVLFALVLFVGFSQAQNFGKKGVIEVGGGLGFSSTTAVANGETADESLTNISVMPYVGYFIIDGLELGVNPLGFSYSKFGDNSHTNLKDNYA